MDAREAANGVEEVLARSCVTTSSWGVQPVYASRSVLAGLC
jgi:hypothetical protein